MSGSTAQLTRSERRSWLLGRELARALDQKRLNEWRPTLTHNLARLQRETRGEPHQRNLRRWASLIGDGEAAEIKRTLEGLDRRSIEMREVSPFAGILSDAQRARALQIPTPRLREAP